MVPTEHQRCEGCHADNSRTCAHAKLPRTSPEASATRSPSMIKVRGFRPVYYSACAGSALPGGALDDDAIAIRIFEADAIRVPIGVERRHRIEAGRAHPPD